MKCPTIDKLSQYVDQLIDEQEYSEIGAHVNGCFECKRIVDAFKEEQFFMKETLQTPTLPDDFTSLVLDKLEPYKQKRLRLPWKQIGLTAAGIVLAVGLSASFNPAFAQWIGGLFLSDQVDEGLRLASEAGFAERVNREVTDNGMTLKVEDIVADSSRVALSYQIFNDHGKLKNKYLELSNGKNNIQVIDHHGKALEISSMSWGHQNDYGLIELSLKDHEALEHIVINIHLSNLNGTKGDWSLDIPVDLKDRLQATKTIPLDHARASYHGVNMNMKKVQIAPSAYEVFYETEFSKEEQTKLEAHLQMLENTYGKDIASEARFSTAVDYQIVNEEGKAVYQTNRTFKRDDGTATFLQSTGLDMEQFGHLAWNETFIPQKEENLTFVLKGVIKREPSDFFIQVKPKDLKKNPISFEYEGNFLTIKEAEKQNEYSLRKSLLPIKKEPTFTIEMKGGKEATASDLYEWILIDENGKAYPTYHSGSTLYETDEHGRHKVNTTLTVYGIDEVPEEFTLHLLSVTRYYEVGDNWKVPLY